MSVGETQTGSYSRFEEAAVLPAGTPHTHREAKQVKNRDPQKPSEHQFILNSPTSFPIKSHLTGFILYVDNNT